MTEQTVNRLSGGRFAPGNKIGRRFQPGQSGNPKGRPPERPLTASLREALDANDGELIQSLAQMAIDKALSGDFRYFKEIMDRSDGKVTDRLGVTAGAMSVEDLPGLTAEDLEAIAELHDGPTG